MPALPGTEWSEGTVQSRTVLCTVCHAFTHFTLDLIIEPRLEPFGEGWWQDIDRLSGVGLPTLYRKAAEAVLEQSVAA